MNKTQLIEGLAKLFAENQKESTPKGAILTELTKIDNAVKQIKSLLTNGKKTRKHTRIGHKRGSKYQPIIDKAVAYVKQSKTCLLKDIRSVLMLKPLEYSAVYDALEHHPDIISTRDEYSQVQYMVKVQA